MAYVIAEPCIDTKDNSCVEVCPVDCIHPTPDEPGYDEVKQLYGDPDESMAVTVGAGDGTLLTYRFKGGFLYVTLVDGRVVTIETTARYHHTDAAHGYYRSRVLADGRPGLEVVWYPFSTRTASGWMSSSSGLPWMMALK